MGSFNFLVQYCAKKLIFSSIWKSIREDHKWALYGGLSISEGADMVLWQWMAAGNGFCPVKPLWIKKRRETVHLHPELFLLLRRWNFVVFLMSRVVRGWGRNSKFSLLKTLTLTKPSLFKIAFGFNLQLKIGLWKQWDKICILSVNQSSSELQKLKQRRK